MADFSTYQHTLPDPNNSIGEGGQTTGNAGPGYSAVKLASEHKIMNTRTNSGRLISRELSGHKWNINLSYNPMTRDEFEPIYTFLLQKRGAMRPFFVSLPQYKEPRDSGFASYLSSGANQFITTASASASSTKFTVTHSGYNSATNGIAKQGDLFTIDDTNDTNHTKVYQIVRVETAASQLSGATTVNANQLRIEFIPALQRSVSVGADVNFYDPKFRVVMQNDVQEYDLNTDNLYSFSLKLEEAQP
jgi:hypothetical protein